MVPEVNRHYPIALIYSVSYAGSHFHFELRQRHPFSMFTISTFVVAFRLVFVYTKSADCRFFNFVENEIEITLFIVAISSIQSAEMEVLLFSCLLVTFVYGVLFCLDLLFKVRK